MIGMTEAEFWASTPRFFDAKVRAHEEMMKYRFEQTRESTFKICWPHLKRNTTREKFWPSPWDRVKVIEWQPIDPAILANFEAHAAVEFEEMRKRKNGNN